MRKLPVLAVTMTFALVGCGKKDAKLPPESSPAAGAVPAQSSKNGPPGGIQPTAGGGGGNNSGVAIVPAGGVGVVMSAGGGGGGGGAAQAVRKAARRTSALNDLKNLGELITGMQNDLGRMPTKDQILAEVRKTAPKIHEAITEGAYVLTGTTEAGGLWAHEANADTQAGIAVIGGRAQRSTPDDLQQYFAAMPPVVAPMPPPQPAAALPAVAKDDMEAIFTFVNDRSGAAGKMPSGTDVYNALLAAKPSTAELVQKKAIFLLQPQQRESVWAVEAKALTQGGMIVTNNGVETVTAAEAKRRTGQ